MAKLQGLVVRLGLLEADLKTLPYVNIPPSEVAVRLWQLGRVVKVWICNAGYGFTYLINRPGAAGGDL